MLGLYMQTVDNPGDAQSQVMKTFLTLQSKIAEMINDPNRTPIGQLFNGIGRIPKEKKSKLILC